MSWCRPPFRHESLFLYLFLQIKFLARCHYPNEPRVTSLVAIRNQSRFLKLQQDFDTWRNFLEGGPAGRQGARMREKKRWLQKEWGRKGGCRRSRAEKVAAIEIIEKAKSGKKERGTEREKNEGKEGRRVWLERRDSCSRAGGLLEDILGRRV